MNPLTPTEIDNARRLARPIMSRRPVMTNDQENALDIHKLLNARTLIEYLEIDRLRADNAVSEEQVKKLEQERYDLSGLLSDQRESNATLLKKLERSNDAWIRERENNAALLAVNRQLADDLAKTMVNVQDAQRGLKNIMDLFEQGKVNE